MAKAAKKVWSDDACPHCFDVTATRGGSSVASSSNRNNTIIKRISELENVDALQVTKNHSTKLNAVGSQHSLQSTTKKVEVNESAAASDWGLNQPPPFQPAAVPRTTKTSEAAKFLEHFTDVPLDSASHPPKLETLEPSVDKPFENIPTANTSSKTQQKPHSSARPFDADSDSDIGSPDTNSEEYRMAKDREYWLSLPSAENGSGLADKPTGVFVRIFQTFTGKKNKAEAKKDTAGSTVGSKSESDEESFNTAREEWVHVPNNRK
jgi:hypothetical protein